LILLAVLSLIPAGALFVVLLAESNAGFLGGSRDYHALALTEGRLAPWTDFTIGLLSLLVTVCLSRAMVPQYLLDGTPTGAAWLRGRSSEIAQAIVVGFLLGACAYLAIHYLAPHTGRTHLSPLERAMVAPGLPRVLSCISAIAIAPAFEEMLFRGILYGLYLTSFGPVAAAVFTTVIF